MSGHSKWNNIKNHKAAVDAVKGRVFSQISRQIRIAVQKGGSGDPDSNASLRLLLDKARAANMPKENVNKAIAVALGKGDSGQIKEITYEAFAPGGVALMISSLTNNKNRSAGEIRSTLSQNGGSLAGPGAAAYMIERGEEGDFKATMNLDLDEKVQAQVQVLVDALRELEDVEDVFAACDLPEDRKE
jgi:YebC/PmpR family DNA-binding regulatory protein